LSCAFPPETKEKNKKKKKKKIQTQTTPYLKGLGERQSPSDQPGGTKISQP